MSGSFLKDNENAATGGEGAMGDGGCVSVSVYVWVWA